MRGSQRTPVSILLNVDQHAARWTLGKNALIGDEIGVLGSYGSGDDFAEGAQLLVGIDGLDRYIDVDSRGARSLQEVRQPQFFQLFVKRFGDSDADGEFRAIGRVEVEQQGM